MFIKWAYSSPAIVLTIEPRIIIIFRATVQSLLKTYIFGIRSWSQTKPHNHSNDRCPIKINDRIGASTFSEIVFDISHDSHNYFNNLLQIVQTGLTHMHAHSFDKQYE